MGSALIGAVAATAVTPTAGFRLAFGVIAVVALALVGVALRLPRQTHDAKAVV